MKKRESKSFINISTTLIVYKYFNNEALEYAINILNYLTEKEILDTIYVEELNNFKNIQSVTTKVELFDKKKHSNKIDLVIIIGGDGTTLWGSSLFSGYKKPPFLTFNLGTLGYLSYYKCTDYKKVIEELLFNDDRIISYEKRSSLDVTFISENENLKNTYLNAMNEVILEKGSEIHMIKTTIYVNDIELTTIRSDGVMIATSTGSTAYSLSSGGPITHFDMDVLILNAICPHTLSFRPIIFTKGVKIRIMVDINSSGAQVGNDGINSIKIKPGEGIEVELSEYDLSVIILDRIIESPMINWRNKLINQLGWSSSFKNN